MYIIIFNKTICLFFNNTDLIVCIIRSISKSKHFHSNINFFKNYLRTPHPFITAPPIEGNAQLYCPNNVGINSGIQVNDRNENNIYKLKIPLLKC